MTSSGAARWGLQQVGTAAVVREGHLRGLPRRCWAIVIAERLKQISPLWFPSVQAWGRSFAWGREPRGVAPYSVLAGHEKVTGGGGAAHRC